MAFEHLQYPPVMQHQATNYCWAAGLSWWLKAVRKYNYDYEQIKSMYAQYTHQVDDGDWGAMKGNGMYNMIMDKRWHMTYKELKSNELTLDLIGKYLNISPVIIGYQDSNIGVDDKGKNLTGFHMNVIVCGAGAGDSLSAFMVMDPNYEFFQLRNLQYYKNTQTDNAFIAYSMNLEGKGPIIGDELPEQEYESF